MTYTHDLSAYNFKTLVPIRFSDTDAFGHVNNAIYLTYFEIARTKYLTDVVQWNWSEIGLIIGRVEIDFIRPVKYGDTIYVYVRTTRTGNTSFDLEYTLCVNTPKGEEVCTSGKTVCVTYNYAEDRSWPIPAYQLEKMVGFEFLGHSK